jgi:hypothetical protein
LDISKFIKDKQGSFRLKLELHEIDSSGKVDYIFEGISAALVSHPDKPMPPSLA